MKIIFVSNKVDIRKNAVGGGAGRGGKEEPLPPSTSCEGRNITVY
jgi:hypothetical protein